MSILRTLSAWGACGILACSGLALAEESAAPPTESLEVQTPAAPTEQEAAVETVECAETPCDATASGSLIIVDRRGRSSRGLVYGPLDCTESAHGTGCCDSKAGHGRVYGRAGVIHKGEAATPSGTTWTRYHGARVSGCYSVTRGGAIYRYNQRTPITDTTPREIVRARQQWLIENGAVQSARIVRKSSAATPACHGASAAAASDTLPEPRAVIEIHKKKVTGPDAQLQASDTVADETA